MFDQCIIRGRSFTPARFCAPLAGYTHSAFRRLLADFGGCGAVWTEMLATRQILGENFLTSPWLRRRPNEACLVHQLMVCPRDPVGPVLQRMGERGVEAVDINMACNAKAIRMWQAGSALFEDLEALRDVLTTARRHWPGLLTAKIRFGSEHADWETRFIERLRLIEDSGVDALTLHPRFFEDKFKRRARHELIPWATSLTQLPVIANGDLTGPQDVRTRFDSLRPAAGVMLGRMAIVRPWIFAAWDKPIVVDLSMIWRRMREYIIEDFPPDTALRRLKMFTKYFAHNFLFGHQFNVAISNAASLDDALNRANEFFARAPAVNPEPSIVAL